MNRLAVLSRLLKGAAAIGLVFGLTRQRYALRTRAQIAATRGAVWVILTDIAAYPEWNSVITEFQGALRPGERLSFVLRSISGRRVPLTPTMLRREDGYELSWRGNVPGLLSATHFFLLSTTYGGDTVLQHGEEYQGALVPFLRRLLIGSLMPDFEQINRDLKRRAEGLG